MLNIDLKLHRYCLMANSSNAQKLFALLTLTPESIVSKSRGKSAIALVIDTSASMSGTKLQQAMQAARELINDPNLDPNLDFITIIQFDSDASTLLPLCPVGINKSKALQAIDQLPNYSGGTSIAEGLLRAEEQLKGLGSEVSMYAKRVILLTDGETAGENECKLMSQRLADINSPIISIGVGDEYNQNLLIELAERTQGRIIHVSQLGELHDFFSQEVESLTKEVVTDVQMKVATVPEVKLEAITRVYPQVTEVRPPAPYRLGNCLAGDSIRVALEFTIPEGQRIPCRVRIARLSLWGSVPGNQIAKQEFKPLDLFIEFTNDQEKASSVDDEVMRWIIQRTDAIQIAQATKLLGKGDRAGATQLLEGIRTRAMQSGDARKTQIINDATKELNETGTLSQDKTRRLNAETRDTKRLSADDLATKGYTDEDIRRLSGT